MTTLTLAADPLPLTEDEHGRIRIAGKRVFLEHLIIRFNSGMTFEGLVQHYDMLEPADIHAVLSYYLRNRASVDRFVQEKQRTAEEVREKVLRDFPPRVSREELLTRWATHEETKDASAPRG